MNDSFLLSDDDPGLISSMPTLRGRTTPRGGRLRAGDVLLGRYTVLSELGEGGMGVVYKCLDSVGGIEVALKCLPPELSRNEAEMEGIRENYGIVAKLHHSAISGLRQLEKDPDFGEYYLVMDLAEGEDLSAMLRRLRGAPMPHAEALAILRPLASALDYAHAEKVLHRDVKPGNVKVAGSRVQLLDFGLAAEVRSSMSRVSFKGHAGTSGTPAYMAPEQWEARRQSAATDQYALATMAYQMLSGALPFDADNTDLLRRAVLSRPPDPVPGLPRAANAALLRALAKEPSGRFPSCTAFVDALARGFSAKRRGLWPWLLAGAAAMALGVGIWTLGGTGAEPVGIGAQEPQAPAPVSPAPPVAQDPSSGGPTSVSAATSGGDSAATTAVSPTAPSGVVSAATALLPATATRAELEDALAQLESRRDALASQGYAADDPERKPVEEALAALRSRIDAALEEETRKAREAELAGRRAAAQRVIDLQSLSDLKKAVVRRVSSLDGTWTDGEFAMRRKTIADAQRELAGCTEASSLARARELRGDIYDAADWIERNAPARAGLADAERSLDALARECAAADAARLAAAALRKAERARKDAVARRDGGGYEEAAAGYASAKALFEAARNEARAAQAEALVAEARAFGESKLWDKCLASAEKALEWDASNAAALALKREAEAERKKIAEAKAAAERKAREEAERKAAQGNGLAGTPRPTSFAAPSAGTRTVVRVGSQEIALRWCPPGSFQMGSPSSEDGRYGDETQHRVTLTKGFYMGETEVTQGLWKEVMGENPSYFKSGDAYPVEHVSWTDCQDFLRKLNAKAPSGWRFALPTEAQWEYACRAGTTGAYGGSGKLDDMGWHSGNRGSKTHPVAQKRANAWGLCDMHGNVWEWCADWVGSYPSGAVTDPTGGASGGDRVLRGGSYWSVPRACRSAARSGNGPGYRGRFDGFRLLAFQDGK